MALLGTLAGIWRYPFKSMQGEQIAETELDGDGIPGDRVWALRDVETQRLVSAKRPRLWRGLLECRATGIGDEVTVELPNGESFSIDDEHLPVALGELLGCEVAIVHARETRQGVYSSDWLEIEGVTLAGEMDLPVNIHGQGTSFVDVSVLHLITTASLATLGAVTGAASAGSASPAPTSAGPSSPAPTSPGSSSIDLRRFRPSILLDTPGEAGFAEDAWMGRTLRIGEVEIVVGEPTPRCIMPTLAQGELPAEPELTRALARIHRIPTSLGTFPCLGTYASVARPGTLQRGAEIELL